ncbi:hypothetical protein Tco_0253968, partial [Tanacetum coccineum]
MISAIAKGTNDRLLQRSYRCRERFGPKAKQAANDKSRRCIADFWDTQQDWKLISWKLHSSSG